MRVLQIGLGGFGRNHLRAWADMGRIDSLFVAELNRDLHLHAARAKLPAQRIGTAYEAFIEEVDVVDIVYTGLRPGEKMFEELLASVERHERTEHENVFVAQNGDEGRTICSNCITRLVAAAQEGSQDDVERILCELLPTYRRRRGVSPTPRMESGARSVARGVGQAIGRS